MEDIEGEGPLKNKKGTKSSVGLQVTIRNIRTIMLRVNTLFLLTLSMPR